MGLNGIQKPYKFKISENIENMIKLVKGEENRTRHSTCPHRRGCAHLINEIRAAPRAILARDGGRHRSRTGPAAAIALARVDRAGYSLR
ncbi:hypothetical protein FNF07_28975 [Trinickia caryophylli]|uniref:hypothetical protein n=1 Tax=Trinickia caryophylli TaxID=28094 RepID=UPI0011961593|nr:hypothetical protein [Trinickia caryophylli]TRX15218.1 hypothetical protein FNF07_28975 [Trinickia caryophylli]